MGRFTDFMISKYPKKDTPKHEIPEIVENIESTLPQKSKRMCHVRFALVMMLLYILLSLPFTFKIIGEGLQPVIGHLVSDNISSKLNWKLIIIHSILFSFFTFVILEVFDK